MSPQKKLNTTKKEIVQIATRLFLEKGFSDTSVKLISDTLGISTGNLTFHYPTKEHLLSVRVKMLCDFQSRMTRRRIRSSSPPTVRTGTKPNFLRQKRWFPASNTPH